VALGAAGSDVAIETADVVIMSDDLARLPWLIRHSRRTVAIIRANIAASLAIKAVFNRLGVAGLGLAVGRDRGRHGRLAVVVVERDAAPGPGRSTPDAAPAAAARPAPQGFVDACTLARMCRSKAIGRERLARHALHELLGRVELVVVRGS
jgi:Cd2+/Zn2+-exporting ATPase